MKSPSGIINCDFSEVAAICLTTKHTFPAPDPTVTGGFLAVDIAKPSPKLMGFSSDTSSWMDAPTIDYGTTIYSGNVVCNSSQAGFTCWNIETHKGALINSAGIKTF